ncbi:hypothetical protein SAMN02745146_1975 [Hymenobacter daecheongensis DSM 21074]|uniref:Uncharacterized protein n=1 Tax=Hymenobacter daecheongensis DSM 21074 TaxID=1121955 RepID=A0A1M6F8P9_9BACT|nr:hypothetical protein [Hymenobacter daecheongensis]SHI94077.1 hypothetical protein SAMN02745146_1975 [Hymenobacter daecheongensis DSM 21074]
MSEPLFDVNLQQLPDEYLNGEWCITNRVLNRSNPDSALALATRLSLQPGAVQVHTPAEQDSGQWLVQRDELLNRPYLELQLVQEDARALITRLRRSADGLQSHLSLYFQSGMELQLICPC